MASEDRPPPHPVIDRLVQDPTGFDLYAALRALECAFDSLPRIGHASRIGDEPFRFGQLPALTFAPATVAAAAAGSPVRLRVYYPGLLGPTGPLPLHLTEYIRDRELNAQDPTLIRFLDIFHHRIIALFYRAWAASQQAIAHQRAGAGGRGIISTDRFAYYIASLMGMGAESFERRDDVPDVAKLHYAGHLSCQSRHAEGLVGIITGYFELPAQIQEFVGQWLALDEPRRLRLGASRATGTLGSTAIVGARVWDRQQKFRIRLGPMDLTAYQALLPGGQGLKKLVSWVRLYVGHELAFDINLVLSAAQVPKVQLGRIGQLGWSSWLTSKPVERDMGDLVLRPAV